MHRATILVAILAFVPFAIATAQDSLPVRAGDRVRVTAPDLGIRKQAGRFEALRADTMVVAVADSTMTFPVAFVTRLEVSRGQKSRAGQGAGIGLVGGGLLGFLISSGTCSGESFLIRTREACIRVSTVGGAVVGTFLGLAVGAVIMTDRWQEVPLDRVRVSFGPQRDGRLGVGASVRF